MRARAREHDADISPRDREMGRQLLSSGNGGFARNDSERFRERAKGRSIKGASQL